MPEAIAVLRDAFAAWKAGRAGNQVRRRMFLPEGAVLHSMAGWLDGYFGTKIYSTHPKTGAWFVFHLFDAATAAPLAQFEANYLGQIRTGAASGLATDLLGNPHAKSLAVIGAGFQARSQVDAIRVVRPNVEVRVWSRSRDKREAFAREKDATACETAEEAVRGADIVCTATMAREPVLEYSWLKPGALVNAIGSNNPSRRELPAEIVESAGLVAADSVEACLAEAGDLLMAKIDWNRVVDLKDLQPGWNPDRISVFKSVGLGLEDVAVAAHIYRKVTPATASNGPNPATR
jgi:ornithine cyclodeaminase/alanine dehydrogenase-like protein (mu-crystallin family)